MHKKVVVKVGTSTLTQGKKALSRDFMLQLAGQLVSQNQLGHSMILVSSGAIAAGRELLQFPSLGRSLPAKQMFAAIGQVQLMRLWSELFASWNVHVGQVLLTKDDFSNRKRYLNARNTFQCLLQHGVIPVVNENDTVATSEIRVGDNDNLAALVANLIGADLLILLTDQECLYSADPRVDPSARPIPVVERIDDAVFAMAGGSSTTLGTGGMATKIEAAQIATRSGTPTVIAPAASPHILSDILAGKQIGTLFRAHVTPHESKKRWLLSEKCQGTIRIDEGAAERILLHGASLLPSGIARTEVPFERGAIVHLKDPSGKAIAVGISNYASDEIDKLIGIHSREIEETLGYTYGTEIIHSNNMVRLKT